MLDDEQHLRPNGPGAQLYLVGNLVTDSAFPLAPGASCQVQVIPNRAVILLPDDVEPDWPLTFHDPDRVAPDHQPHSTPTHDR